MIHDPEAGPANPQGAARCGLGMPLPGRERRTGRLDQKEAQWLVLNEGQKHGNPKSIWNRDGFTQEGCQEGLFVACLR